MSFQNAIFIYYYNMKITRKKGGFLGVFNKNQTKKMNYKIVSPEYTGKTMTCEICGKSSFYSIDISVDRSKTANLGTEIIFGHGSSEFINHPLKMYTCTECNMCKFMYQSTRWNGITQKIIENPV